MVLLVAAAIVPPALIIGESVGSSNARHGLPIAGTAIVVSILVFVRMFGLTTRVRDLAERRGRDRFEAMVQHSQDIITVINPQGRIEYVSPAVREQWGYTPEECLGQELRTLISLEDSDQGRRHLDIAMELSPASTHEFEVRIGNRGRARPHHRDRPASGHQIRSPDSVGSGRDDARSRGVNRAFVEIRRRDEGTRATFRAGPCSGTMGGSGGERLLENHAVAQVAQRLLPAELAADPHQRSFSLDGAGLRGAHGAPLLRGSPWCGARDRSLSDAVTLDT